LTKNLKKWLPNKEKEFPRTSQCQEQINYQNKEKNKSKGTNNRKYNKQSNSCKAIAPLNPK
jgi:hypothetical protein